jgi:hypothetical protein
MLRNESDRKNIVIQHSKRRDSNHNRFLKGLEGNKLLDNPLISFEHKEKMAEHRASNEALLINLKSDE